MGMTLLRRLLRRKQRDVLICVRASDIDYESRIAGTKEIPCTGCGEAVLIAGSGRRALRENDNLDPYCGQCVVELARKYDAHLGGMLPGQEEELIESGMSMDDIEKTAFMMGIPPKGGKE